LRWGTLLVLGSLALITGFSCAMSTDSRGEGQPPRFWLKSHDVNEAQEKVGAEKGWPSTTPAALSPGSCRPFRQGGRWSPPRVEEICQHGIFEHKGEASPAELREAILAPATKGPASESPGVRIEGPPCTGSPTMFWMSNEL